MVKISGEYTDKGDYHKNIDSNWPYYPVYVEKIDFVEKHLNKTSPKSKIVDLGCGEGTLVEKYQKRGYNIQGVDPNYTSKYVKHGDITKLKLKDKSVDLVLCLDVIEHLSFTDQEKALNEIERILKPNGKLILSVPNLAHFASRISFLMLGKLLRTSTIERHIGDRPQNEYKKLLKQRFRIIRIKGLFPTYPFISLFTLKSAKYSLILHKLYNRLLAPSSWCFLTIFVCEKK